MYGTGEGSNVIRRLCAHSLRNSISTRGSREAPATVLRVPYFDSWHSRGPLAQRGGTVFQLVASPACHESKYRSSPGFKRPASLPRVEIPFLARVRATREPATSRNTVPPPSPAVREPATSPYTVPSYAQSARQRDTRAKPHTAFVWGWRGPLVRLPQSRLVVCLPPRTGICQDRSRYSPRAPAVNLI